MKQKTAILMMAYGGPDSLESVEPYLLDVRGGRPTSVELVEEIRQRYAEIGGKSPLLEITLQQAKALETHLNLNSETTYQVFVGMRHWFPYIREAVVEIASSGMSNLVTICMTPFFSKMSTGAYYEHLDNAIEGLRDIQSWQHNLKVTKIGAWYTNPLYIQAIATNLKETLVLAEEKGFASPTVIFTAHSLPKFIIEKGDPYAEQFKHLAELVAEASHLLPNQWSYCFQSAGASNMPWLGPSLEQTLEEYSKQGEQTIIVAPIGFLSDHVEVLFDIDIEAKQLADQLQIKLLRMPSLNDHPLFIQALGEIIKESE
ncbi:MAG TPA: ferrochelatase [Anaerolineaceae bacterium]|nr:ferrochelatase [Anaerolineaceae bacterium]